MFAQMEDVIKAKLPCQNSDSARGRVEEEKSRTALSLC